MVVMCHQADSEVEQIQTAENKGSTLLRKQNQTNSKNQIRLVCLHFTQKAKHLIIKSLEK